MRLNLTLSDNQTETIDINKNLILRAKNYNLLDCYIYNEDLELIDVTGATLFLTVKNKSTDADASAVLSKTITTLTDPQNGQIKIELTDTDTDTLVGSYIYDIKIKLTTGEIYTLAEGWINFKRSLTVRES